MNLQKDIKKVHFIGIGGIGVSAIARMMLMEGKKVSGSDRDDSRIIRELKKLGAKIYKGHHAKNVQRPARHKPDLVVYTTAIDSANPELKKAKKLKIPTLSYPEILGLISKDKYTIAISGAHGKTTTTAMIAEILIDAKFDPNVIIGSLLKKQKSNFIAGKSKYFICEACEYKRAFLNLNPKIIVITNIDNDHLDYYKNLKNIQKAFSQFVSKLGKNDFLVYNSQDKNSLPVAKKAKCKIVDYSKIGKDFKGKIPGEHNIKNAQAALAVAKILKIKRENALKSLENFSGTWRRFEYKGKTKNGVLIYDDYAHHPTEIKATLRAGREFFGKRKIWCVFQPHLYSRTKILLEDFARSFRDADEVIITDIYAAREKNDKSIHAKSLGEKIKRYNKNVLYLKKFADIEKFLKKKAKDGDVIMTMGAGDIFKIGENLLNPVRVRISLKSVSRYRRLASNGIK
jgi:UDP-N-acetylmuramate--alanine ligase